MAPGGGGWGGAGPERGVRVLRCPLQCSGASLGTGPSRQVVPWLLSATSPATCRMALGPSDLRGQRLALASSPPEVPSSSVPAAQTLPGLLCSLHLGPPPGATTIPGVCGLVPPGLGRGLPRAPRKGASRPAGTGGPSGCSGSLRWRPSGDLPREPPFRS